MFYSLSQIREHERLSKEADLFLKEYGKKERRIVASTARKKKHKAKNFQFTGPKPKRANLWRKDKMKYFG